MRWCQIRHMILPVLTLVLNVNHINCSHVLKIILSIIINNTLVSDKTYDIASIDTCVNCPPARPIDHLDELIDHPNEPMSTT